MKTLILTLFCCILLGICVTSSKGHIGGRLERCICNGQLRDRVRQRLIQRVHVLQPSISCSELEILVTVKGNKRFCLNPEGRQGKRIINFHNGKAQGKRQKPNAKKRQNRRKPN